MTPDERSILESTHQLAKDNNEMLRSLKRRANINTSVKVLYWVVIIALSFGAAYLIKPYVDMIKSLTGNSSTSQNTSQDSSLISQIQDLLK